MIINTDYKYLLISIYINRLHWYPAPRFRSSYLNLNSDAHVGYPIEPKNYINELY